MSNLYVHFGILNFLLHVHVMSMPTVLCPEKCIAIATKYVDPTEAAEALVGDALKEWSKLNDYVDDITAIVIFVD